MSSPSTGRLSTGVPGLDPLLGGGLLPGTLTVVVGASGIGKTQLGLQFAAAGAGSEPRRGLIFDMNARIDSQSHAVYAERMLDWRLQSADPDRTLPAEQHFDPARAASDYLHIFRDQGRRVGQRELGFDDWHDWQVQLAAKLQTTISFFYLGLAQGARRVVVDGLEPIDRPSDSIQFELFEYIYHQILRKESEWVARDLLRERYREFAERAAAHRYDHAAVGCVLLYTSHEAMLEAMIGRPLADGDLLATANTLIYMGKVRDGHRFARGLYIAKHRGSSCDDQIAPFAIDDRGVRVL